LVVGFGFLGVLVGVADGVKVGVGGGPSAITSALSEKPGTGVEIVPVLLLPVQLSINAPKTNNKTGAITSHLSHRDNIKH
jgi:hypothetical protein